MPDDRLVTPQIKGEESALEHAFLSSYFVDNIVPYLPVHESFEDYIESFGGRMIFIYMIFIFVKDLDEKLIYMYTNVLGARVSTPPATGAHKS